MWQQNNMTHIIYLQIVKQPRKNKYKMINKNSQIHLVKNEISKINNHRQKLFIIKHQIVIPNMNT